MGPHRTVRKAGATHPQHLRSLRTRQRPPVTPSAMEPAMMQYVWVPPPPLARYVTIRMGWRMRRRRFRRGLRRHGGRRSRWLKRLRRCLACGSMGEPLRACGDESGTQRRSAGRWAGRANDRLRAREGARMQLHRERPATCVRVAYGEGVGRSRSGPTSIRCVASRMPPQA